MGSATDSLTWLALGTTLTVAGLLAAALVWSRRGPGRGLQVAGLALLPLAAALTGVLRLAAEIVESVGDWAVRLVFSPSVWLGIVVAGVAVLVYGTGRVLSARSGSGAGPGAGRRAPREVEPGKPAPAAPLRGSGRGAVVEDQDDIEAILRKHGIQ